MDDRSFVLQAENEFEMNEWITLLQAAITRALQSDPVAIPSIVNAVSIFIYSFPRKGMKKK